MSIIRRRTWHDIPLSTKLTGLTGLLVLGLVLVLTFLSIQREQKSFRNELENEALLLLETLPLTIRDQLYRLELDELRDIANVVGDNENISFLYIYDKKGALLVDASQTTPIYGQEPDPLGAQLVNLPPERLYMEWQADQLVAGQPIYLGNQVIGAISLGLSTASLDQKILAVSIQGTMIAIATLAISILLAIFLSRQITNPLGELTSVAGQMAAGDLQTRVQYNSDDEVGQLGRAFNQMAEAIHRRETDLRDLANGLEAAVRQRTAELEDRNNVLILMNEELQAARRAAEEASRLKSQFLAAMSHELRTPLNAIMGFSQLLAMQTGGPLSPKQLDQVDRILRNAENLLNLINEVLDLAKIEAGRIELIEQAFHVETWMEQISHQLEGLARDKNLRFVTTLDGMMPDTLVGDPERLKQIAVNLLSNAIKFTEEGEVVLAIDKNKDNTWTILVADTGIGIDKEALEYIFEEFRQVDGSIQRKYSGTGLGLAIVKNLAKLMGGSVSVKSEVGKGSRFMVTLPLKVKEKVDTL